MLSAPSVFLFSNHHFLWQNLQLSFFLLSHVVRPLRMAMLKNQLENIVLGSTGPILHPQKNVNILKQEVWDFFLPGAS